MPDAERPDFEARLRAEVDRTVAPYVGVAPPFMVAKLRELAERYWRENPVAARVLAMQDHEGRLHSGTEAKAPESAPAANDVAKKA